MVYHLEKWRCYLEGVRFRVITDHQPNIYFQSMKQVSPRLARWYERISLFDFEWQYKPGRLNVADSLSRNLAFCNHIRATAVPTQGLLATMITRSSGAPAVLPAIPESTHARKHWDMRQMLGSAHDWKPANKRSKQGAVHAPSIPFMAPDTTDRDAVAFEAFVSPMNIDAEWNAEHAPVASTFPVSNAGMLVNNAEQLTGPTPKPAADESRGPAHVQSGSDVFAAQSPPEEGRGTDFARSVPAVGDDTTIPNGDNVTDEPDDLQAEPSLVEGDAQPQTVLIQPEQLAQGIKEGYAVDPLFSLAETDKRTALGITATAGNLFMKGDCICVPNASDLYRSIIRELHCSPYSGHLGMNKTYALIRRHYYWPSMQEQINAFVRGCVVCQRNKAPVGQVAGKSYHYLYLLAYGKMCLWTL